MRPKHFPQNFNINSAVCQCTCSNNTNINAINQIKISTAIHKLYSFYEIGKSLTKLVLPMNDLAQLRFHDKVVLGSPIIHRKLSDQITLSSLNS